MAKGQLPKAYLRLDPNIDQRHPDVGAFVRLLCAAARQPRRGVFKDRRVLDACIGKKAARAALERDDVVETEEGSFLVDGWDAWQEGDHKVGDRMAIVRSRHGGIDHERTPGAVRTANWRMRGQVYERDLFICRYCGRDNYQRDWLVADHVIPLPDGPTTMENLVTACRPCKSRKGRRTPEQAGMVLLEVGTRLDVSQRPPLATRLVTRHAPVTGPVTPSEAVGSKAARQQGDQAPPGGGGGRVAVDQPATAPPPPAASAPGAPPNGLPDHDPDNALEARLAARVMELAKRTGDDWRCVLVSVSYTSQGKHLRDIRGAPTAWLQQSLRDCDRFEEENVPHESGEEV